MKSNFSKGERRLLWISGVSLTCLLSFGWWWTWSNADPQITIAPRPAPPKPNAYDFYVQANRRMVWALGRTNETDIRDDLLPAARNPQQFLKTFPLKDRNTLLNRNKAALRLTRQGFAYDCQIPEDGSRLYNLPYLFKMECRVHAAQGNWNSAGQSALDCVHFGVSYCQGGGIIAMNISNIILGVGFRDLEAVLQRLDAPTARTSARQLRQYMSEYPSMTEILQNEKRSEQRLLTGLFNQKNWRSSMIHIEEYDSNTSTATYLNPPPPSTWQTMKEKSNDVRIFFKGFTKCKRTIMQNYNEISDAAISASQKPYQPFKTRGLDAYSDSTAYLYHRKIMENAKYRTRAAMIETALALRSYKLEKGHYPTSLNELVPNYLPLVPQDAFASKTLRYKHEGATYKLWSIGPDMKDDRGTPARDTSKFPDRQTIVDYASKGDFVYGVNR